MPNFKKQEHELETLLDKWLYVFKQLPMLQARPARLQERVFDKLFRVAEIARYSREEQSAYIQSRKYYWDLNNVIETANTERRAEGYSKGLEEGREEAEIAVVVNGYQEGFSSEQLSKLTKLSLERVCEIIANHL